MLGHYCAKAIDETHVTLLFTQLMSSLTSFLKLSHPQIILVNHTINKAWHAVLLQENNQQKGRVDAKRSYCYHANYFIKTAWPEVVYSSCNTAICRLFAMDTLKCWKCYVVLRSIQGLFRHYMYAQIILRNYITANNVTNTKYKTRKSISSFRLLNNFFLEMLEMNKIICQQNGTISSLNE